MTTIKTTWGKIFEKDGLVLFNEYPNIVNKTGDYEELYRWYDSSDEDEYDNEIYQWYIVPRDYTVEWLKEYCPEIAEDIHYSETIGHYILAVRHWGTGWDYVPTTLEVDDEDLAKLYQKTYHDDLSDDVKHMVFNEDVKKGE